MNRHARLETYGPVAALDQGRPLLGFGPPLMRVRCYCVDGLLIDCGLAPRRGEVLAFARQRNAARCYVTHHHEDHSGNARALVDSGVAVLASKATAERMARGFSVRLYERIAWGAAPRANLMVTGAMVETDRHRFEVIEAPGHCDDQTVLLERNEGWLFAGDVFLAERIKLFRGDEDFGRTIATLRRLVALPFDALFCAHRPVPTNGRKALKKKLRYLLSIEGQVQHLADRGIGVGEIARRVLGHEELGLFCLSFGDVSKRNVVRSILHGPVPRRDALMTRSETRDDAPLPAE